MSNNAAAAARYKQMHHVVNEETTHQPLLEMLDSRSCCPAGCQRICCGACIRFCSPWRTCMMLTLFIIASASTVFVLQKLGIIWAQPAHTPPPSAPGGPYLRTASTMWLGVGWSSADTHGDTLSEYHVAYRSAQMGRTSNWTELNVGTALAINITGLSPLTTYAVRVIAFTSSQFSNWTDIAVFATLNGSIPTTPGQAILTEVSSTGLELIWAPSIEFGVPVLAYQLQMRQPETLTSTRLSGMDHQHDADADVDWQDVYYDIGTRVSVSPLDPSQDYEFRLRSIAVNNQGNTSWCEISRFHTDNYNASVPQNGTMHLASVNSHSAIVWWDRPTDGGSEILGYTIEHDSGGGTPFGHQITFLISPPFNRVTQLIEQLSHSTTYQIHFRAYNHLGEGAWSDTILVKTTALAPPDSPTSLTVVAVDQQSQTIEWKPGKSYGADILGYQLEKDDWWNDQPFRPFPETLELIQPVTGLLPAVAYNYRVRERNKAGWSGYTNLTASTLTYGACGNPADMQQYKSKRDTISATVKSCMTQCIPYPAELKCTRSCVVKNLGISNDCGMCYEEESTCIKSYCAIQCVFGKPVFDCAKCVQQFCFPALVRCTGIPAAVLPP